MVAGHKKKAQKKRAIAGPTAMEVPDPGRSRSPLEVPEESPRGQPPPVGPRMESSSALDVILQLLRENSVMSASQSDPMGVPTASSSSFSPHQMILDAAQPAASSSSASVYPGDALSEPPPPSSSEQFSTASSTVVYSETEKKAYQMLAAVWTQERISASETACVEAEESGQQEDTFSGESLLIAPEYKTKAQLLTRIEEKAILTFDALLSQEKIPESRPAHTEVEESDKQKDASCGTSPREYKRELQVLIRKLPETPQPPPPAEMQKRAPLTATQLSRRRPTNKRSGSSASASAAASAGALGCLASSPPTEVMSPTKRPRASIAWRYFTKHPTSKFIATCDICGLDVMTGRIGGCGKVGTSTLLSHIKRIHHIAWEKKAPSVPPAATSKISNMGRPSAIERPRRTGSGASAMTLRSLASSLPTEVMSPTKHPRASVAWRYFTKYPMSKFIATCDICGASVQMGTIGGKVGTARLHSHLKGIHHIVLKK
ncbi:UNVERIFIED_CONTAM: hypothetical protein K2H54_061083 [Gekko kuhli]